MNSVTVAVAERVRSHHVGRNWKSVPDANRNANNQFNMERTLIGYDTYKPYYRN